MRFRLWLTLLPPAPSAASCHSPCSSLLHGLGDCAAKAQGVDWLAKGCLDHGGAQGQEHDVFLKNEEKGAVPSTVLQNNWPGLRRGY